MDIKLLEQKEKEWNDKFQCNFQLIQCKDGTLEAKDRNNNWKLVSKTKQLIKLHNDIVEYLNS